MTSAAPAGAGHSVFTSPPELRAAFGGPWFLLCAFGMRVEEGSAIFAPGPRRIGSCRYFKLLDTNDSIVKQTDSQDVLAFQNGVTIKLYGATHRSIAVLPRGTPTIEARE